MENKEKIIEEIKKFDIDEIQNEFHWVRLVDDDVVKEELKDNINKLLDLLNELVNNDK